MLKIPGFCASILGSNGVYWNVNGVIYAGNGTNGSALYQLSAPSGLFIDLNDTLYISDSANFRVLAYLRNAAIGSVVAGSGTSGKGLHQFSAGGMRHIYVDPNKNIYVSDVTYDRVTRWPSGGSTGVLVSGNGTFGSSLSQLYNPFGVWADSSSNVFVAESNNFRVTKWTPGASVGVVVAGITNSSGTQKGGKVLHFSRRVHTYLNREIE